MSSIKIGAATLNQTPLDWKGNFNRIVNAIEQAKSEQIEILCFPELAITGYGSEDLFLSYWYPKKALEQLKALIPHTTGITVAVGLPVRIDTQVYNTVAIVENGQLKGFVAKQFLAIDGVHYEFRWFTPWKAFEKVEFDFFGEIVPFGDVTFHHKNIHYGFEICEDAWRGPVRPGYRLQERKVDLIFNPSASHFAMGKTLERKELIESSSEIFDCYYCYVNLLGNEAGRMIFDGETMLAKSGKLLYRNQLLSYQDCQLQSFFIKDEAQDIAPVLEKEKEFVQAASLALFDYLRKSRSKGFVLSLSGGADSSTIAVLVAEMVRRGLEELGVETFCKKVGIPIPETDKDIEKALVNQLLTTAYQGTKNSSEDTFQSAKKLAESLGAVFYDWKIDEEVESYTSKIEKAIGRDLTWEKDDITLQNIQARARSPIIWMLANINNALLLSTSNRSEGDVGYATMDGDTSGSISPIAAVDKYFILHWLRWAQENLDRPGLQYVNSLQPTAELRPLEKTQTDEKDLMPYSLIVEIEKLAIRDQRSPMDIYLILKEEVEIEAEQLKGYIKKFFQLWSRNQWKRERLAPSFHLDQFNVDPKTWFRFPILSGGFAEELELLDKTE
ncbi:NAD(+) synthase [Algoriphagus zhangzhouensis]|uniref:Glutamine-dependent NAD(+) synthetase n=1 Tax=Algoriphagus zhangzhouensis TaxID=1073327 RepID=A0A1M7Z473_9BACT|nr:NAD(+) synthase [Algoriphagus zhangzhouensis]TDY48409.1 NAD+ synthase (glutamine-hydrolysing) [Algoriphagus zhangzhouensis]SHO59456.1 NAD+ synthase (glutamine-hydrolysing) [Algoriphagus zhangzhouensis]